MKIYVFYIQKLTRIGHFGVPPNHVTLPHSGTFCMGNGYTVTWTLDNHAIITIQQSVKYSVFKPFVTY